MANLKNKRPILVTGSHRSGSTWVGKMINLSPKVGYIHEPFSPIHRKGICKAKFKYWFQYVCKENEEIFFEKMKNCLEFKYNLNDEIRSIKSFKDFARLVRDYCNFSYSFLLQKRPLIKDPIAFFSAEWLADQFDMDIIVLIRHPLSFIGSLKKLRWYFPFEDIANQPLLINHNLYKFKDKIYDYSKNDKNIIDQGILLWNLIHHVILEYQNKHPNWIFIKHEDLSKNPSVEFKKIFNYLGIETSPKIFKKIIKYSSSSKNSYKIHQVKRNSVQNLNSWKSRLSSEEIIKIKNGTNDIAKYFYSNNEWYK